MTVLYYEDIVPHVLVQMKLYRYFRTLISFPMGHPLAIDFGYNVECEILKSSSCHYSFIRIYNFTVDWRKQLIYIFRSSELRVPSPRPKPQRQSRPNWKGKRISVHAGKHGLELVLLPRIEHPRMSRDTNFPTELQADELTWQCTYSHTVKLGSTSFLIFIPVLYQVWSWNLNPTALEGSRDKNSYSLLDASLPLHTPSSHSPSGSIYRGHFQPSDTAPYALICLNTITAAWSLLAEALRASRHPPNIGPSSD